MFKHLSRVKIEFNPLDPRARSALEFLAQCNSRKTRASNPDCQVIVQRRTDDWNPQVTVTFLNGKEEVLDGSKMHAQVMRKRILEQADFMETEQLFKDSGLDLFGHHPSSEGLTRKK